MGKRVRATKCFSSRTILGMLLGWALAFEGFFALSLTNSATVDGIGGIRASTFSLASIQLIILGAFILIAWIIKEALPGVEKRTWGILFSLMVYLGTVLIIIEGLAIIFLAGDVIITDFGLISKVYIVLTGAQLFALGVLNLRLWRLRNVQPTNWLVDSLGSIVAVLMMAEGLSVIGLSAYTKIEGLGGVLEQTVNMAGLQLFIIGMLIFLLWTIVQDQLLGKRMGMILTERRSIVLIAVLSGIVVLEGAIASAWAGSITNDEIGGVRKMFVVAGCAQLFAIGVVTPLLWKLRSHKMSIKFFIDLIGPMAMALIATEGVVAIGLAASTRIDGIGGIKESTFFLAGAQLIILASIGLFAYLIKDSAIIGTRVRQLVDSLPIVTIALVGLEGIVATVLAAQMWITDFSSVRVSYVLIVGIQLTVFAAIALASWARTEGMTMKFKVTATGAAAFVALMLPIALLL